MATNTTAGRSKRLTLRDVVNHTTHMAQRLSKEMLAMEKRLSTDIQKLDRRMGTVEENLTKHINALEEDLIATMKDTVTIRRYVGMAVPDDE